MTWLETVEAREDNNLSFIQTTPSIDKHGVDLIGWFDRCGRCGRRSASAPARIGLIVLCGLLSLHPALPSIAAGDNPLDRGVLDHSLQIALAYLQRQQRSDGNFNYQYNWASDRYSEHDSEVRQAIALWSLASAYRERPDPATAQSLNNGFAFHEKHSEVVDDARFITYPGVIESKSGTIALVSLALMDFLQADKPSPEPNDESRLRGMLDTYLHALVRLQRADGLWNAGYALEGFAASGTPSPYYDGAALLAVVVAAKHFGRDDLLPNVERGLQAGHRFNVEIGKRHQADAYFATGYYPWASIAYYEVATAAWPFAAVWEQRLLDLTDWVVDEQYVLQASNNTSSFLPGVIYSHVLTQRNGAETRARKYSIAALDALATFTGWQVGSRLQSIFIDSESVAFSKALGGVQDRARGSQLRIDVTAFHIHAVILARKYLFPPA